MYLLRENRDTEQTVTELSVEYCTGGTQYILCG